MAKGQLDDPFYYNLSDGATSTVVNPWGQGDSATALRVIHAGDATASVSVVSNIATLDVQLVSGSVASVYANNPSGAGDGATALRIIQAGDFVSSVYVNNPFGQGDSATALRMIYAGDSGASVNIISGSIANTGFNITGQTEGQGETDARTLRIIHAGDAGVSVNVITALPTGANVIGALSANQSINNAQVSGNTISVGDGEVGVGTMRVVHAADFGTSVNVITALPAGANTIGAVTISGSLSSAVVVGLTTQGAADIGEAPVKFGGIGITANPTAVTGGRIVTARFDKIGRQLTTPYQIRDLIGTAFITLATSAGFNTETTLIAAGAAGVFNDIIEITCTNDSTVAAIFDLRDGTASGVVKRFVLPANATFEKLFLVPLPQNVAGTNAWTVKNAATGTDATGTNVTFSSIYAKNV